MKSTEVKNLLQNNGIGRTGPLMKPMLIVGRRYLVGGQLASTVQSSCPWSVLATLGSKSHLILSMVNVISYLI
jgi:hypothetical protein